MARTSLQDVAGLRDPAQTWNFDLFFDRLPSGVSGNLRDLTFRVKTTQFPGANLDAVEVELHGVKLVFAGRATYDHEFTVTFYEGVDWSVRNAFYSWRELMRSWQNNSGSTSDLYKSSCTLSLYDDFPNESKTIKLAGVWPKTINSVDLDGGESAAVMMSVTFSFDYIEE